MSGVPVRGEGPVSAPFIRHPPSPLPPGRHRPDVEGKPRNTRRASLAGALAAAPRDAHGRARSRQRQDGSSFGAESAAFLARLFGVLQLPTRSADLLVGMPWSRKRGVLLNIWGLFLDAVLLAWLVAMVAQGCAVVLAPVDAALDHVAVALTRLLGR